MPHRRVMLDDHHRPLGEPRIGGALVDPVEDGAFDMTRRIGPVLMNRGADWQEHRFTKIDDLARQSAAGRCVRAERSVERAGEGSAIAIGVVIARDERHLVGVDVALGEDERELLGALLDALEPHEVAGVEVLVGAVEWSRYVDGVSNLAHKVVDLTDTRALALLVEMEERVFCVTRSRTPELDASRLAGTLGGGGHPEAASAIFRGRLGPAKERLLAGLQSAVRELPTAAEIMIGRCTRSAANTS